MDVMRYVTNLLAAASLSACSETIIERDMQLAEGYDVIYVKAEDLGGPSCYLQIGTLDSNNRFLASDGLIKAMDSTCNGTIEKVQRTNVHSSALKTIDDHPTLTEIAQKMRADHPDIR